MARILTGIQSSGKPHLGNILGAILPGIRLSQDPANEACFFIADLHSLTTVKDARQRQESTLGIAAAWLAFGYDTEKNLFYRQSKIPEVCELTWHLACFSPFPMLANAHSFKDKSDRLADINGGLFIYPVLMAADILMYDANFVPVGKDQQQHLEMTRDIAVAFNNRYGETFVVPEVLIDEQVMTIPGTDGQKMSKTYRNTIDIFLPEKELRKQVMSIVTDSTPLDAPKNPDTCTVFAIYRLLAGADQIGDLRRKYETGGLGYGHAKQMLFELILDKYRKERMAFEYFMRNPEEINHLLETGEKRARDIGITVLNRVREKLGFGAQTSGIHL